MDQEPISKSKERIKVPSGVSRITDFCEFRPQNSEQTSEYFEESALPSPYPILVCHDRDEAKLHNEFPGRHITTFDKLKEELYATSLDLMGMTPKAKKEVDPINGYGSLSNLARDMELWSKEAFNKGVNELALPIIFEPGMGKGILFVALKVNYLIYDPKRIESIIEQEPDNADPKYMFEWNGIKMHGNYKRLYVIGINEP